ncbi:dTDP-4-amino-4,6-dideoxyglucose formyltransferase [Citrobacter telavivensis]
MKKILIISDNPSLASYILDYLVPEFPDFFIEFNYSSANKTPEEMIKLGAKKINLKDKDADFAREYDVIFSIHCKQIFPKEIVNSTLCVNVHPGLNPNNRGWYPQVFSIINKKPIGATIHVMNEDIDAGDIIIQEAVLIDPFDTSLELYNKVQEVEKKLLGKYFEKIIRKEFTKKTLKTEGNYNSISDFNKLCKLDLTHVGTLGEHIDLLRALTHGDFKNSYIENDDNIKKYVRIQFD